MVRRFWLIVLALSLLAPAKASAGSAGIERRCTAIYPSMSQYFAWKDCLKTATEEEAEERLKRQKEDEARPCLAADIARMEGLAVKARAAVNSEMTLEDAQAALIPIARRQGTIAIAKDNIKDRVLVTSIETACDASFHFLINVREGSDKKLRWVRVWAENPPAGYTGNLHQEFGAEFEADREDERVRAEAAKRDADFKAFMAKQEQDREEQRRSSLRNVKISDVKLKCMAAGFCSIRTLEFVVTNLSKQPIKRISFGWMLRSPQMTECPSNLATKETSRQVLQPGERAPQSFYINNGPESADARYCLSVTEVEFPMSWER
jgi:hypothetical protein